MRTRSLEATLNAAYTLGAARSFEAAKRCGLSRDALRLRVRQLEVFEGRGLSSAIQVSAFRIEAKDGLWRIRDQKRAES